MQNPSASIAGPSTLRAPRPKSFALDDLALPSPVPSLAKVLEDGRQLEQERKAWQAQATRSFQNKRARHDTAAASAFDILAERTLLGNQARAPTVHVRPQRSQSQSLRGSDEHGATTISGSGVGANTSTSTSHQTHTRTRSRSHAHSNSAGSVSLHPSNESFMWTPGHGRNHSIGKSALRLEKAHAEEKWTGAGGIEDALRRDGTKVIRLHDQLSQEERGDSEGIVVITPPAQLSPGVGIAISSPPRSEDHSPNYPDQEPIRIPAHPYAQGAVYSYNQPSSSRAPVIKRPPDIQVPTIKDGVTRHRQPILVHPYSPYAQVAHPYAAPTAGQSAISTSRQHLEVDPHTSMFAELSPGKIRVIQPEEIQYSPFTPVPTVVIPPAPQTNPAVQLNPTRHPYGPSSKRVSEWGFAEALSHTLLGRGSTDSGLGTSEDHENALPDSAADDVSEMEMLSVPKHGQASSAGRGVSRDAPRVSSNHTLASSPMDSINPPLFRRTISATSALQSGNSSGSSPGMVSHESSPPLSPRPINTTEDLERFRDLFYNPPAISPEDTSISFAIPQAQREHPHRYRVAQHPQPERPNHARPAAEREFRGAERAHEGLRRQR
ncbi:hypothetical protein A0H81_14475 [Grifola frondosa]|uniref:Uncharacterized protein n=1 Tax=Grifola frondosa TaxID=5627 RepID=A0A1C7LNN6_GRIFR|nr:hypothetical protein A0H81_14475 [Grifola frondosa]